jgi:hypothetical protein
MVPFVFWLGASISLVAAGIAVFGRRPILSVAGLGGLMLANSILFLLLSAPLLAFELLLASLGVGLGFWVVLVRPRHLQLAAPGRVRFSVGRLVSLFVAGGLGALLVGVLDQVPELSSNRPPVHSLVSGWMGAWVTIFLVCTVVVTTVLVVRFARQPNERENQ